MEAGRIARLADDGRGGQRANSFDRGKKPREASYHRGTCAMSLGRP